MRQHHQAQHHHLALAAAGILQQLPVISVDENIAMYSAKLGQQCGLAMADSMILVTAQIHHAVLWTQNTDFKELAGVKYFEKPYFVTLKHFK